MSALPYRVCGCGLAMHATESGKARVCPHCDKPCDNPATCQRCRAITKSRK